MKEYYYLSEVLIRNRFQRLTKEIILQDVLVKLSKSKDSPFSLELLFASKHWGGREFNYKVSVLYILFRIPYNFQKTLRIFLIYTSHNVCQILIIVNEISAYLFLSAVTLLREFKTECKSLNLY